MSYRDDMTALEAHRSDVERELREINRELARLAPLTNRAQELDRELDRTSHRLEVSQRTHRLPLLQNVRVASPCAEQWKDMAGGDRVRHCRRCDKNVYDLSGLTSQEAEHLLRTHEGGLCIRFYRRRDGTVLTQDCPSGRLNRALLGGAAVVSALSIGAMAASCLSGAFVMGAYEPHTPPEAEYYLEGEALESPEESADPLASPPPGDTNLRAASE